MSRKIVSEAFTAKPSRNDRFAQMSRQEQVIEQKKREIQARLQQQQKEKTSTTSSTSSSSSTASKAAAASSADTKKSSKPLWKGLIYNICIYIILSEVYSFNIKLNNIYISVDSK